MKKALVLTTLTLVGMMAINGCSFAMNGEYKFDHIEYQDGDETVSTDCSSLDGLPILVQGACASVNILGKDYIHFKVDGNKFFVGPNDTKGSFFKVEDNKIKFSSTENGEYYESKYEYSWGKIYYGDNIVTVYKK